MKLLQEILAPHDNANDELITIVTVPFADGAKVTAGTLILEYENSKALVEITAESDGYVKYSCVRDQELPVGSRLLQIFDEPCVATSADVQAGHTPADGVGSIEPRFSRAAAALLDSHQVAPARFAGRDFVTAQDVMKMVAPGAASSTAPVAEQSETPSDVQNSRVTVEPLSAEKKTELRYLSDLQPGDLNSSVFIEISVGALNAHVAEISPFFKKSLLPLVVKEASALLAKYTQFNAYYASGSICRYREVSLGLTVDFGTGLKVVKLPSLDGLSLQQIEISIVKQMQRCFKDQLAPAEMGGTTFTITDLSQEGVFFVTPLINRRQGAILSLAAASETRGIQVVGLTFDHRIASGRDAAQFLRELKDGLESYPPKPESTAQ